MHSPAPKDFNCVGMSDVSKAFMVLVHIPVQNRLPQRESFVGCKDTFATRSRANRICRETGDSSVYDPKMDITPFPRSHFAARMPCPEPRGRQ